ncbi:MAG: N-acetylmuramoyl-L-alanine amidase [Planctomycetes bacterium]|nr:N-acetylmuramoyl-L-alanine amidase [Planctomycetota bacterium]
MHDQASRAIRALLLCAAASWLTGCIQPGPINSTPRHRYTSAQGEPEPLPIARLEETKKPEHTDVPFYELAESYGLKVSIDLVTGRRVLRDGVNQVVIMPSTKRIQINERRFPLATMIRWRKGVLYVPAEARVFMAEFLRERPVLAIDHDPTLFDGSEPGLERPARPRAMVRRRRPSPRAASGGTLPASWGVKSQRRWRYIVIHHSATTVGGAKSFHAGHKKRGWKNGLGYHFVIGNGTSTPDGKVEVGGRWIRQNQGIDGAHAGNKKYNKFGIGICLVGNYNNGRPTPRQLVALRRLCRALMEKHGISRGNVFPHSEVRRGHTDCPGKRFPLTAFKRSL